MRRSPPLSLLAGLLAATALSATARGGSDVETPTRPADAAQLAESSAAGAQRGDPSSATRLGLAYRDGVGVERDDAKALEWLRRAAEQGDPEGQAALGTMLDVGRGTPRDAPQAAAWFRRAAEQGHTGARFSLGAMLVNGEGIPRDLREGLMWLELSREESHSSRYLIFRLEGELDAETLAEGRRAAAEWRASHPPDTP